MKKPILWNLSTRVVGVLTGFMLTILTARLMSPEDRGSWFFWFALILTISQFGSLGMPAAVTILASRRKIPLADLHGFAMQASLLTFLLAALVIVIGFLPNQDSPMLGPFEAAIVVVGAAFFTYLSVSGATLNGAGSFKLFNSFELLLRIATLGTVFLFLMVNPSGTSGLLGLVVAGVSVAVLQFFVKSQLHGAVNLRSLVPRDVARFSLRTWLVSGTSFLLWKQNVFLAGVLEEPRDYGLWSVGGQLIETIFLLSASLATVILPEMGRRSEGRLQSLKKMVLLLLIGLLTGLLIWITAGRAILALFFGDGFGGVYSIVLLAFPGIILYGLASLLSQYISAQGTNLRFAWPWLAGILANLCVVLGGSQWFGISVYSVGFSAGMLVTLGGLVILLRFFRRKS